MRASVRASVRAGCTVGSGCTRGGGCIWGYVVVESLGKRNKFHVVMVKAGG